MIEVKSSNIKAIGYLDNLKILQVIFHQGGLYYYYEVEKQTFDEFLNAKSIGSYFGKNIRNKYKTLKVQDEK